MTLTNKADNLLNEARKHVKAISMMNAGNIELDSKITIDTDFFVDMCKVIKELNEKVKHYENA